ncbi:kinase-like domain-containing protein [Hypoxylon cercidicola]|nr:kinase-like domain-containing protein [Hypoxylon cercidicola]
MANCWRLRPSHFPKSLRTNSSIRWCPPFIRHSFIEERTRTLSSNWLAGSSRSLQTKVVSPSESPPPEELYHPTHDSDIVEGYRPGGYHPTTIGDMFRDGRYKIVHKLGFSGSSAIWLARDRLLQRFVSLKIQVANAFRNSNEGNILRLLQNGNSSHPGKQFVPALLDQFTFEGPNGQHLCLVGVPHGYVSASREISVDDMFPIDAARSIAAQLAMGLVYLHECGICHGDLNVSNFLLRIPNIDSMTTAELYDRFGRPDESPVCRLDEKAPEPHAPSHVISPMMPFLPSNEIFEPEIVISEYEGTSFLTSQTPPPKCLTPDAPPELFFQEPMTPAADVWTLGVNLYDVLGDRPLFETVTPDRDTIIGEMISTLGRPPERWWSSWADRPELFAQNEEWRTDFLRICTPVSRRLRQRLWNMGRGKTPETCKWDVAGGEFQDLEDLLRDMMTFEPADRLTPKQVLASKYMVKWALPAWQRQVERKAERVTR